MSAIRKLASQTAVYGLSSIIGRVVVWGLTPIYTAMMPQSEYGIFSDLYAFVTYFLVILTFGMETSFFRYSSDKENDHRPYSQSFLFVTALALFFALIFGLSFDPVSEVLGYGDRSNLILMVIAIIAIDVIVAMPMAKLRFDERPKIFAAVTLFTIFLNLGLNIFFYVGLKKSEADYVFISNLIASGVKFLLLALLSSPITSTLGGLGSLGKKLASIDLLPKTYRFDKELVRPMIQYGLFIMVAGLFGMINQNSDVNFIKRVWGDGGLFDGEWWSGAEMAGIFSANKKLAVMIILVTQAFRYAAEPFFFKQAKEQESKEVFAKVFHYFMMAGMVVYLLVGAFAHEFVSIEIADFQIIDKSYHSGLGLVPFLLFAFLLWGAYINISIWFKITKQVRFGLLFSGIGTAVIVILNLVLIPWQGYYGSAIAMIACYGVMVGLVYFFGRKYYPVPYRIVRTGIYLAATTFVLVVCGWIEGDVRPEIFDAAFWYKLLLIVGYVGIVAIIEKVAPTFKSQPPAAPPRRENVMKSED